MKDVKSFLCLANFYRRFVPKFADIAAPLTALTADKAEFTWEDVHYQAFEKLKEVLASPPIITYPTPQDKFVLSTDACDIGLGAILSTAQGKVIEYASWVFTLLKKTTLLLKKNLSSLSGP